MPWKAVLCPKNGEVAVEKCLECLGEDQCPPLLVRKMLSKGREYSVKMYYVTELVAPRQAYYNRVRDYSLKWEDLADVFLGLCVHSFLEKNDVSPNILVPTVEYRFRNLVARGRVDAYDPVSKTLFEWKTDAFLAYRLKDNAPDPDHVLQARFYSTMLVRSSLPVESIHIVYFGKTRTPPRLVEDAGFQKVRWKSWILPHVDVSDVLEQRLTMLHESLEKNTPPAVCGAKWRCKNCQHREICLREVGT